VVDRRPLPHEWALVAVAAAAAVALLPQWLGVAVGVATVLFAVAIRTIANLKWRLVAAYAFVVGFYFAAGRLIAALDPTVRDPLLRAADETLFRSMPCVAVQAFAAPWLTDLASACYLSYYVYLHAALGFALLGPARAAVRYFGPVCLAFAVGFAGYLLVPALSPALAYPEAFGPPLTGGPVGQFTAWLVAGGSTGYDTFPSLHVLVTGVILREDWRSKRWRFWLAAGPSAGMVFATLYLRYHYAVDLLIGVALVEPVWRIGAGRDSFHVSRFWGVGG
jgi:hypothetical protein